MSAIKQKFNGKPLIEVPKEYPTIGFLEGDFGKEVLNEYKGRAKDYNKHLDILSYKYNIVQGSNPFAVVLMNKVLNEEGLKTASQSDLEKAIKLNALSLNGTYEDTALILRNENNPNSYLAKHLMKQVKERNKKAKTPIMITLNQLELVNDTASEYGLAFKLKEDAEIIYAPILNDEVGNFSSEDIDEKTGLPIKLGKGNRTLYTRDSGLSRLCLGRNLGLSARDDDLANSDSDGRVVVVSGEATEKFSNEYKTAKKDYFFKLRKIKENIDKELNE